MENNICIIYAKYIKYSKLKKYIKTYLSLLIILLSNTIHKLAFCSNEIENINNSNTNYKQLKDPTMPKTFNIQNNKNQLRNNSDSLDNDELLKLTMIITKDRTKTVNINNQLLKEQDQIEGYMILKIEQDKVLLQDIVPDRDEKFYNKFKKFFSSNKVLKNQNQEKFIELYLPRTTIKQPIIDQSD